MLSAASSTSVEQGHANDLTVLSENNMWKPHCSTPELILTSFIHPAAWHTAPPTICLREGSAATLPLEASHDREHSTSSGSLTFHPLYFVIPLMHGRCLLLLHFWHMLNVKKGLQTIWSKTPGSPISFRERLHQLAMMGLRVTDHGLMWSVHGSVFYAILQINASHLSSDAGIITWSNTIKISEPSVWARPPFTNLRLTWALLQLRGMNNLLCMSNSWYLCEGWNC